jgi:hypothetical protein
MTEATNNLFPPAATPQAVTLARWLARKAVKAEWHKQGLRWRDLDGRQLTHEAKVYFSEHYDELVAREKSGLLLFTTYVQKGTTNDTRIRKGLDRWSDPRRTTQQPQSGLHPVWMTPG